MENIKSFGGEISYIQAVMYSKDFEEMTHFERKAELEKVLQLKLKEVYDWGVRVGENKIKSKIENALK